MVEIKTQSTLSPTWAQRVLLVQTSRGYSEQWWLSCDPDHMRPLPALTWKKTRTQLRQPKHYNTRSASVCHTVPVEKVDVWYILWIFRKKIWFSVHAIQDGIYCCSWKETSKISKPTLPANDQRATYCHLTRVTPMKVSARLMDCEEMAILKPRPSAGMMVDWQMKLSTELTNWAMSLWSSTLDTSVTLSVQIAALFPFSKTRTTA